LLLLLDELVPGHLSTSPGGSRTGWWSRSHGGFVVPLLVLPVPLVVSPPDVPPLHCLCLARNAGNFAWPSESHGGFDGGGLGVPFPPPPPPPFLPSAMPGTMNIAVAAMATRMVMYFLFTYPPLRRAGPTDPSSLPPSQTTVRSYR